MLPVRWKLVPAILTEEWIHIMNKSIDELLKIGYHQSIIGVVGVRPFQGNKLLETCINRGNNMTYPDRFRFILIVPAIIIATCFIFLVLAGCGGDDDPVAPIVIPATDDVPEIPSLSSAYVDPPIRSESLIVLKQAPDYVPVVIAMNGNVLVKAQGKFATTSGLWIPCYGNWNNSVFNGTGWINALDDVSSATLGACGLLSSYTYRNFSISVSALPAGKRTDLLKDNQLVAAPAMISWTTGYGWQVCRESFLGSCTSKVWRRMKYEVSGQELVAAPFLRRERFWVAVPWESGNLVEGLNGAGTIAGTTTYSSGCDVSETESIALTLGSEVGGSFEGFSAKVSTSLTTTFSTTVTVSQSTTTSFTRTLEGIEGKRTRFVLWVLRERFSFANEDGTPFTDENYVVEKGVEDPITGKFYMLEISGGQAEATKYIFDLKSDKLLDTVTVD